MSKYIRKIGKSNIKSKYLLIINNNNNNNNNSNSNSSSRYIIN